VIVALFSLVTALIVVVPAAWGAALVIECCIHGATYDDAVADVEAFIHQRDAARQQLENAARPPFDPTRYSAAIDWALPVRAEARRALWPHGNA
jgi:hypothetical protein